MIVSTSSPNCTKPFVVGSFISCRQLALEQMTLRDNTLNEIFDLDFGEEAEREFVGAEWTRATTQIDDE